jgi:GT2 family glycosyltransferase
MHSPPVPDRHRFHVVIVLQNQAEWLPACLAAAMAQTLPPAHVTLFDNLSAIQPGDETARGLEKTFPEVRVMRAPKPLSFAACCNRAAASHRDAATLLLLNADAIPAMTTLETIAAALAAQPSVAVMGCKVLGGDVETIEHLGSRMRGNGLPDHFGRGERDEGQYHGVREALSVQSAALAVRSEVWCELGGLDESFWPAYFEVADFCFRARAAQWKTAVACDATVTYFGHRVPDGLDTAGRRMFFLNRARFLRKHYSAADWIKRFAPDEARWLCNGASRGMKSQALLATVQGLIRNRPSLPQTVQ